MDIYYSVRRHPTSAELGLPPGREYVFAGLYLGWIARRDLLSAEFRSLVGESVIQDVQRRALSGPRLLEAVDGILEAGMLLPQARTLSAIYFSLIDGGRYLADYRRTFAVVSNNPRDLYGVEDTWTNFDRIAPLVDEAFAVVQGGGRPA